jgi:hypothetical protein
MKYQWLMLGVVMHMVPLAHAQSIWLENFRGVASLDAYVDVPSSLAPWFYSLSTELQQQWQVQLDNQLTTECHRTKAPTIGEFTGLQVSRHGVQWFDDFSGHSHRLLTQRMQTDIGRHEDSAMPWLAWNDGAFKQLIWQDIDAGAWRSLRWAQGQLQELGWQQALPRVQASFLAIQPSRSSWFGRSVVLVPAATDSGIQLLETNSGSQLLASEGDAEIAAWPAALDIDGDAQWDRFYQVDRRGRVWRLTAQGNVLSQQPIADLSASGWQFDGAINAVRAQWPTTDGTWHQGDVLIIVARANPYGIIVLPLADEHAGHVQWSALHNAEQSPSELGQGWYLLLGSAPVANSQVMAGVLYLPLHFAEQACAGGNTADQVLALHLFRGSAAYAQRFLPLERTTVVNWQLQRQGDHLALQLDGVEVVSPLRQISALCDDCTRSIELPRFNRWLPLGVFPAEQGAY